MGMPLRITAVAMVLTFAAVSLVTWYHTTRQIEHDRRDAELLAMESAHLQASRVKKELHGGLAAAYSLKSGFLFNVDTEREDADFSRHERMENILMAATRELTRDFAGVFLAIRPGHVPPPNDRDDFDAPDMSRYYTLKGYYISHYTIDEHADLKHVPPAEFAPDNPETEPFFSKPRDSLQAHLHEPYRVFQNGKPGPIGTTITLPIVKNGDFIGVAGVNMNLERILEAMAEKVDFHFGQGFSFLVSPSGTMLPFPEGELGTQVYSPPNMVVFARERYRTDVFHKLIDAVAPGITEALREGTTFHDTVPILHEGREALVAGVPFRLEEGGDTWLYLVAVPTDVIDRQASMAVWEAVGIGAAAIAFSLLISALLGSHLANFIESRRRWFEAILDRLPTPLVIRSAENKEIQFINQAVERRLGVENREVLIGHSFPIDDAEIPDDNSSHIGVEFSKDGRDYRVHTSRLADDAENTFAILEVATDVTEEKALARALSSLSATARELDKEAGNIAALSEDVRTGVFRQALEVEQISKGADAVEEMAIVNTEAAKRQSELAQEVHDKAEALAKAAEQNSLAMRDVVRASQSVRDLMKLIDDVAFRAKLLGLNAAVEASRVGSIGKSFRVVAAEIQELSARSAKGVQDTSESLQMALVHATTAEKLSEKNASALQDILLNAKSLKNYSGQVVDAAREQSEKIIEVNASIRRVNDELQRTSQTTEKQAAVAEHLKASSSELKKLTSPMVPHNTIQN